MATCVTVPLGPACVDITGIRAGDLNQIGFAITSGGVPMDLTGLTLEAQARKKASDPDPPTMTAVIVVSDAVGGKGVLRWPGDQVQNALAGKEAWSGVWDLQMSSSPADDPVTVAAGKITAVADVTRP